MKKYLIQCREIIIYIVMDFDSVIGDEFNAGAFDFTVIEKTAGSQALFCLEDEHKSIWHAWNYTGDNTCLVVRRLKPAESGVTNAAHGFSEGAEMYTVYNKEAKDLEIVSADMIIKREQLDVANKRIKELEQWKEESLYVWSPILDYCQDDKNSKRLGIGLGQSISSRVLEILKEIK